MKAEFLKLAGVKSEKAFYKKYPTEAAFFKAHPEAKKSVKKAQYGTVMSGLSDYLQSMNNTAATPYPGTMFKQPGIPMANYQQAPNYDQMYMSMSTPDEQLKSYGVDNGVSTINASTLADDKSGYVSPGGPNTKMDKLNNLGNQLSTYAPYVGQLIGGYQNLRAGRRAKKEAQRWAKVTDVQARASETEDVDDLRQYADNARKRRNAFMPEMTGEEFFPVYGVGTNVLARNGVRLEDGGMVGGNPTEIQNTYEGGTDIYTDLEYEPLYNVDQIKSYRMGGYLPKAQGGAEMFSPTNMMSPMGGVTPWGAIGGIGSSIAGNLTGNDGGGQIGGAIGGAAGMALGGPMGAAIGQTLGTAVGGLVDTNDRDQRKAEAKIKANTNRMVASQYRESLQQGPFGSYMKDGGWVSNDWTPQVIASFGDVTSEDYHRFAHKDEFRAGGHLKAYREPSERAMQTYDMGGELKTHWGGYAEPMSENPYLPGTGETVMFRGKSHEEYSPNGETGIGITYGDNPVEVERGEPAVKLKDGSSGEESLVVYGNLQIPKYGVDLLEDKNAKGKKFKNYVADLSKTEVKQNKLIDKSTDDLDRLDVKNSFDKLKLSALEANIKGGNMKLKSIADKKVKAADLQNAINETAEEYGLIADDLAKGKVKQDKEAMKAQAKYGAAIKKAQYGLEVWEGNKTGLGKKTASEFTLDQWNEVAKKYGFKGQGNLEFQKFLMTNPETSKIIKARHNMLYGKNPETDPAMYDAKLGRGYAAAELLDLPPAATVPKDSSKAVVKDEKDATFETVPYQRSKLLDIFGEILPYIRPTDQEALNARQLMGETYAMSTNQLEPVQATPYTPQLRVPYDISRQAAKNDLIAQTRAAQRMAQGNPEMQAAIAAQAYNPMQQLNEQDFIDNQRMRDAVYSGNIATLNDAELKNLAIYDQQYTRQEQAKSNTKATAQAALNSISDKYAKNALENRTLGVYENLYNYRYDKSGRAINMNAPFQPNIPYIYGADGIATHKIVYDKSGKNITGYQPLSKEESAKVPQKSETKSIDSKEDVSENEYSPISEDDIMYQERNGGKTKKKKYSQSSIVRAFK
jgi:hypothetical protein